MCSFEGDVKQGWSGKTSYFRACVNISKNAKDNAKVTIND